MKQLVIIFLTDKARTTVKKQYKKIPLKEKIAMKVTGWKHETTNDAHTMTMTNQNVGRILDKPETREKLIAKVHEQLQRDGLIEGEDYQIEVI